ncbi:MAG TPA: hypothetical protein ENF86_02485 [Firmicutes bacterium]|nr:hypothetical protein [Bacillota bacterium]
MNRLLFLTVSLLSSWVFPHPCLGEGTNYNFNFSQMGKTFNWNHSLNFKRAIGDRLNISASSQLRSKLTKSARRQDRWQDRSTARFSFNYPYSEKITLSVSVSANESSDNLYSKEPVQTRNFSAVFSYKPFRSLSLSQSVGQAFDRRRGHGDSGLSYNLAVNATPRLPENTNLSFHFGKSGNSLKRRNLNSNLGICLSYRPGSTLATSLSLSQSRNEQGYYTAVEGKDRLFVRRNHSSSVKTDFNLKPKAGLSVGGEVGYSYSQVRDPASHIKGNPKEGTDNEKIEFNLATNISAKPFGANFTSGVNFQKSNSDYRRFSLDKKTASLSVKSSLDFNLTQAASVSFSTLVAKYSTDTPDPQEVSDRDDFKSNFKITYIQKLRDNFELTISGGTDQNHTVNLESERSANNHWTRRYSLNPRMEYRPSKRLRLSQNYMLTANYTEYDFDEILNPDDAKSNISRMLSASNSVNIKLTPTLNLTVTYGFKARDYGKLYQNGSEAVAEDSQNHSVTFSLSYQEGGISLMPRYTWNRSKTWKHKEVRELFRESTSRTFTLSLSWGQLSLVGVRSVREGKSQRRYVNDNISVRYSHTF